MKAKYYPNCNFLSAKLGSHPSFTRISIWSARGLLEARLGWRVGDGSTINIWNDAWLPGPSRMLVLVLMTVEYGEEIIHVFISLKTVTNGLLSDPTYQREDSTQTINQKKSYNILWNLKVASKTKIAVWRIIHSYIPTLSNLQSIKLPVVDICPFCKSEKESVSHIFWECTTARDTLQGAGIDGSISPQGQQWKNWLANLFSCMNEEKCTRLVITLWAIWNQRNKTYHQGERQNIARLTSFIKAYEAESILLDSSTSRNMNQQNATWQPPRPNEVKGNFDAAYNKTLQDFVTEIIFRDYEGFILAACTYQNHFVADATTAEAIVCLQTVPVAEELGFRDLAIEGDSFTVVLSEGRRTTRRMLWLRKGNNGRSQGFGSKKPFQKPQ